MCLLRRCRWIRRSCFNVIAGLDPAIHLLRDNASIRRASRAMDARVKPAHDGWGIVSFVIPGRA